MERLSHHDYTKTHEPPTPCTAAHITFGGRCLNCGYDPEPHGWTRINDLHPDIIGYAAGSTYEPVCQLLPPGIVGAPDDPATLRKEANAALIMALPELVEACQFALTVPSLAPFAPVPERPDVADAIRQHCDAIGRIQAALQKAGL